MKIVVEIGIGDFIDRYIINEIKHEKRFVSRFKNLSSII